MTEDRADEPGFEQQLADLEEMVAQLEGGELGLEDGVARYREGVELLKSLNAALGAAEQRVEELTATLRQELAELEQQGDVAP